MEQIVRIADFVIDSFIHIWPYLVITIPLAVAMQLSGAAKYINKAFSHNPLVSIFLATVVGAFSPFCSCGVIPVIASLLIGGVPLAPVMSFWIASPSMDPEIFFLSVASIGWELSIWRLGSTFIISLFAGYITHIAFVKGLLGSKILRKKEISKPKKLWTQWGTALANSFKRAFNSTKEPKKVRLQYIPSDQQSKPFTSSCCISVDEIKVQEQPKEQETNKSCGCTSVCKPKPDPLAKRVAKESWIATTMVVKFMALAFVINALIQFYMPQEYITGLLGGNNSFSVLVATFIGVPVYTSNITALPLISGLLTLGMNKGAALAFLISGPATTLPAMVAVWGIVRRKIFVMYILFALVGALATGLLFNLIY